MKRTRLLAAPAVIVAYLTAAVAVGVPIINNVGITGPHNTVTFSELSFPTGTPITNQFAGFGATFSPPMFYNVQPDFFPTPSLASYDFNTYNNTSIFSFGGDVSAAAVAVMTNPIETTFTALRDGVVIESFSAATAFSALPNLSHANDFFGFQGIVFDEFRIENAERIFQLDNFQFVRVPEPSTLSLLSLLGLFAANSVTNVRSRRRFRS